MSKLDRCKQATLALILAFPATASIQAQANPRDFIEKMVVNEDLAEQHRGHFLYLSQERSERTAGHLWTERIAETSAGKVRFLIAEDGLSLTGERLAAERARLADIAAHPDAFERREQALKNDERHAKQMLELLPKAFLFDPPTPEGSYTRIAFHPNPAYQPQSLEERILHAMSGSILVDPAIRLHRIEGRLPEDVIIGFGLVATIKAGSSFSTTRERVAGNKWKTASLDTAISGRAIFFKTIGRQQHAEHTAFKPLADDITVPQAVALLTP